MIKKINLCFHNSLLYSDFAYDKKQKKILNIFVLYKEMKQLLRLISFIKKENGNLLLATNKQIDYFLLKTFINNIETPTKFSISVIKNYKVSLIQNNPTIFLFLRRYFGHSYFSTLLYNKIFLLSFFNDSLQVDSSQGLYKIQNDVTLIKKKLFLIGFLEKLCAISIKK